MVAHLALLMLLSASNFRLNMRMKGTFDCLLRQFLDCPCAARDAFSARENVKMAMSDIHELNVSDAPSTVNLGPGVFIKDCSTYSSPQRGTCQVYFTDICISENSSTRKKITISSATVTAHFRFIRRAFVVYSFDEVFMSYTSFYGMIQALQPRSIIRPNLSKRR